MVEIAAKGSNTGDTQGQTYFLKYTIKWSKITLAHSVKGGPPLMQALFQS